LNFETVIVCLIVELYFIITKDNSMVVSHIVETNIESVRITPILHTTIWYISYNNADKLFI